MDFSVTISGRNIPGLFQASVLSTNSYSSDTLSLTFAIDPPSPLAYAFWGNLPTKEIVVSVDTSGRGYVPLITAIIDTLTIDPIRRTVCIEGRDLSSLLIDSYRQQDFINQTASEVVASIANYHSLTAVVSPTELNVGRYYTDGYTKISLGQFSRVRSDWDLVVQLARENGYDAYVEARSLYFQPTQKAGALASRLSLKDLHSCRLERNLMISEIGAVTVQSWNSQTMTSSIVRTTATSKAERNHYLFSGSNYTPSQTEASASRYGTEVSRLANILFADMPWNLDLKPRTVVFFDGTNSLFDSFYRIDSVDRHYSAAHGSHQTIRAVKL